MANRKHRAIHNVEIDLKSASHFVICCLSFGIVGGQAILRISQQFSAQWLKSSARLPRFAGASWMVLGHGAQRRSPAMVAARRGHCLFCSGCGMKKTCFVYFFVQFV